MILIHKPITPVPAGRQGLRPRKLGMMSTVSKAIPGKSFDIHRMRDLGHQRDLCDEIGNAQNAQTHLHS